MLSINLRQPVFALLLLVFVTAIATAQGTRLLRHPTVSRELVAFEYAGDLWVVARSGGQARRVTSTQGVEIDPYFSPDGSKIAFTSTVAGNTDVYVVPTTGGKWAVENEGVVPDIEVAFTPADAIKRHDPQLERAVQEALKMLAQNSPTRVPRPAPINRVSNDRQK